MPQTAGLRIAWTRRAAGDGKKFKLTVAQPQVQLIITSGFPVIFTDNFKSQQIHVKMPGSLIVGTNQRNMVYRIQFHKILLL